MGKTIVVIRKFFGAIFLLTGVVCALIAITGNSGLKANDYVGIVMAFAIGAVLFFMKPKEKVSKEVKASNAKEKQYEKTKTQVNKSEKNRMIQGKHTTGLPIAEGADCEVYFGENQISIAGTGAKINLDISKLVSIDVKTETEIQKAYVSSLGGAVGGAVLFGPLGAVVGGRAKQKTSENIEYYMIITYKKGENLEYLSFVINRTLLTKAHNIASLYNYGNESNAVEINL